MPSKRIGIITHYYGSTNYGGVLQAYALCKIIDNLGFPCEQICFDNSINTKLSSSHRTRSLKGMVLRMGKNFIFSLYNHRMKSRYNKFDEFRNVEIPHSPEVYYEHSIGDCVKHYDTFITGSDQVWNLKWYAAPYFLSFVPKDKEKISYAASLGTEERFNEQEQAFFSEVLKDYKAISVREESSIMLLGDCTRKKVETVADPTLLLTREKWDEISSERMISGEYLLCYFLGDDKKIRRIAREFCKQNGLKLIVLPRSGRPNLSDFGFGDRQVFDAGPKEFLSLIKYATYVMTDSFHACVFSSIFDTSFLVFTRKGEDKMSSRIYSLLFSLDLQQVFCDTSERLNIQYANKVLNSRMRKNDAALKNWQKSSMEYLLRCLQDEM